jgi:hypothetical protein
VIYRPKANLDDFTYEESEGLASKNPIGLVLPRCGRCGVVSSTPEAVPV